MRDDRELLRLHVTALFAHDGDGRMTVTNEPARTPAPRLFLGWTAAGNVWLFRHDLRLDVVDALQRRCSQEPALVDTDGWESAPYLAVLGEHRPVESVWHDPKLGLVQYATTFHVT